MKKTPKKSKPRKAKPKVTVLKENYDRLKEDSQALRILQNAIGKVDAQATGRVLDLIKLEHRVKRLSLVPQLAEDHRSLNRPEPTPDDILDAVEQQSAEYRDADTDLGRILAAFQCGEHPTLGGKICFAKAEISMLNSKIREFARKHGHNPTTPDSPVGCLHKARHMVKEELRSKEREVRIREHQVTRLKRALQSALNTNSELARVMGMFEEDQDGIQ